MTRIDAHSYWCYHTPAPKYSPVKEDLAVDVLVVGGGHTGVTAAYLLKRAGLTVALVERGRCGCGDTAHTTAHLTCVTDKSLTELVEAFGKDHAQAIWDAGLSAIDTINTLIWRERIQCQFEWVPGYLFDTPERRTDLRAEARTANELGFDAEYVSRIPLLDGPGIRYDNQAKFHPRKYLLSLLRLIGGKGSYVFENTDIESIEARPRITATTAKGHRIHCGHVFIATHVPLQGMADLASAAFFQSKLAPYTSYAIGGWVRRGSLPEALFWDTGDPYDYLRVDRRHDHDYVIFGGEDHKTGQVDQTSKSYAALEERLKKVVPDVSVTHRWSGQVIETIDGLPYIGETAARQFVATGFGGNGLTFGTVAAMMVADAITGRPNPWRELFDPGRTKVKAGLWNYLKENKDYPYYMIRDRFAGTGDTSLRAVKRGTGQVIDLHGEAAAVYRGLDGKISMRSAVCTHMGCYVHWNDSEWTWDCPCHGSRFKTSGEVIAGPAETPLAEMKSKEEQPNELKAVKVRRK